MRLLLRLAIVVGVAVGGFAQGQPVGMLVQGTMTRNAMYLRLFQEIAHFEARADGRETRGATAAALRTYQRQRLGLTDGEAAQLRAAALDCVRQLRTEGLLDSQGGSRSADDSGMIRAAMISARVLSAVDALSAAMGAEGFARLDSKVTQYLSTPVVLTGSPTGAGAAGGNLRSARSKGGAVTMLSGEGCSDPTPEIVDITPGSISYPWQAGGLQEFAISGTGFGTAPTITVSGDVGSYGVYHGGDTSISAWVDLTSSMGGSASVSVTSNGYTGNGFIEGSEHNSPTSQSETAQIAAPPPTASCPTTISVSLVTDLNLPFGSLKTGIGAVATMSVGPSSNNYQGVQLQETLSAVNNTCPASFGNLCGSTSSTFTVGFPTSGFGENPSVNNNQFSDWHYSTSPTNVLDAAGIETCSATCSQVFTCSGSQVGGSFSIQREFDKAVINGQNVTRVKVTKN